MLDSTFKKYAFKSLMGRLDEIFSKYCLQYLSTGYVWTAGEELCGVVKRSLRV